MIKLKDLINVTDSDLCIMHGASPMLLICKKFMTPGLISPELTDKEVLTVRSVDGNINVWLKEEY